MITEIPLSQLRRHPKNVRTVNPDSTADQELIAGIRARGLQQNLVVVPDFDNGDGPEAGYLVVAGGRRLGALQQLVEAGELDAEAPQPCQVRGADESVEEIGLVENLQRADLHPADKFEAFKRLADQGSTDEEIARRFGIETREVKKLLRLAGVHPDIVKAYRKGKADLQDVMAFAGATNDQAVQRRVFKKITKESRGFLPGWRIREEIAHDTPRADDILAKYVGLKAYQAAGGGIHEDLFQEATYLTDRQLLEKLAQEKFDKTVARLKKQGYGWVTGSLQATHFGTLQGLRRAPDPKAHEKSELGCHLYLDSWSGKLKIERDLLAAGTKAKKKAGTGDAAAPKPRYSEAVLEDFRRWRAIAYRVALAQGPGQNVAGELAMFCVVKLGLDGPGWQSEVPSQLDAEFTAARTRDDLHSRTLPEPPWCVGMEELQTAEAALPVEWMREKTIANQFAAFLELTDDDRMRLIGFAMGNLMAPEHFDKLAPVLSQELETSFSPVEIAAVWRPSRENLFKRLTKDALLQIGAEIADESWAQENGSAKKGDLVDAVDNLATTHDWRPAEISAPLGLLEDPS